AFEQKWRSSQGGRDVVKSKVAAVTLKKIADFHVDSQEITNRAGILPAVQPMMHASTRTSSPLCCDIVTRNPCGAELHQFFHPGGRRTLRRHGASTELANNLFPNFRVGSGILEIRGIQCKRRAGGYSGFNVMAGDAVLGHDGLIGQRTLL